MYVYKIAIYKSTNRDSNAPLSLKVIVFRTKKNKVLLITRLDTSGHKFFFHTADTAISHGSKKISSFEDDLIFARSEKYVAT